MTVSIVKVNVRETFFLKKQTVVQEALSYINIFNWMIVWSPVSQCQPCFPEPCLDISGTVRTLTPLVTLSLEFASGLSGMFGHLYLQMCVDAGVRPAYCEWHKHTHTHTGTLVHSQSWGSQKNPNWSMECLCRQAAGCREDQTHNESPVVISSYASTLELGCTGRHTHLHVLRLSVCRPLLFFCT